MKTIVVKTKCQQCGTKTSIVTVADGDVQYKQNELRREADQKHRGHDVELEFDLDASRPSGGVSSLIY